MNCDQLFDLFSYSRDERNTFSYAEHYMRFAQNCRDEILKSRSALQGHALAGLFLTFRACNAGSGEMSTKTLTFPRDTPHGSRLQAYGQEFGHIESATDYRKTIGYTALNAVLGIDRFLIRMVKKRMR